MSNEQIIKAWVLQLGLDLEPVAKGVKKTEGMLRKLERNESKLSGQRFKSLKAEASVEKQITTEKRKQEQLTVKRTRAQTSIQAIERRATAGGLSGEALNKVKEDSRALQRTLRDVSTNKEFAFLSRRINRFSAETSNALKTANLETAKRNTLLREQSRISERLSHIERRTRMGGITQEQSALVGSKIQGIRAGLANANSEQVRRLATQTRYLNEETSQYIALARRQRNAMTMVGFAAKSALNPLKNLAAGFLSVYTAMRLVSSFHHKAREHDSLKSSLLAASGTAEQADEDFKFLIETARRLGVDLTVVAQGYKQIGSAGRQMGWSIEQSQDLFLSATKVARAYGLSAERIAYVYLAISQIQSKGKVSMEELRRQLGEHLPGAMNIAASAMGVTTMELEAMIARGLSADEFLPRFSEKLREAANEGGALARAIDGITAAEQRMAVPIQQAIADGVAGGYREGYVQLITGMTAWVEGFRPILTSVIKGFGHLMNGIGKFLEFSGLLFRGLMSLVTLFGKFSFRQQVSDSNQMNRNLSTTQRIVAGITYFWTEMIGQMRIAIGVLDLYAQKMTALDMLKQVVGIESRGMREFREVYNRSREAGIAQGRGASEAKNVQVVQHNTFTGNPEQNVKRMEDMFQTFMSYE